MTGLIVTSLTLWIAGFFVNKFTLYQVMIVIPTVMFSVRKVGIHLKPSSIITAEIMFLFFSTVWKLLFHKFVLWRFLLSILLRVIFICIVMYDDTVFIYKQEERKKQ